MCKSRDYYLPLDHMRFQVSRIKQVRCFIFTLGMKSLLEAQSVLDDVGLLLGSRRSTSIRLGVPGFSQVSHAMHQRRSQVLYFSLLFSGAYSNCICIIMLAAPGSWAPRTTRSTCLRAKRQVQRRRYAVVAQLPQTGDNVHGFTVKRTKHVPELELTALQLQHDKTGAEYLHVAREDKNNVFSIGFKTNPPDHTGVPHILEHLVLCGSEKYVGIDSRALGANLITYSDIQSAIRSSR